MRLGREDGVGSSSAPRKAENKRCVSQCWQEPSFWLPTPPSKPSEKHHGQPFSASFPPPLQLPYCQQNQDGVSTCATQGLAASTEGNFQYHIGMGTSRGVVAAHGTRGPRGIGVTRPAALTCCVYLVTSLSGKGAL